MSRILAAVLLAYFASHPWMAQALDFGFAAISCGHDDPHDDSARVDYSDEVADFTNLNQVCVDTPKETTRRLAASKGQFTALLYIEPIFFQGARRMRWQDAADQLWPVYADAIRASDVMPVFYLADEPMLRHLDPALIPKAANMIRAEFPGARIAMVEAYLPNKPLTIAPEIDLWGFNAYAIRDPAADPGYMAQLKRAQAALAPHQNLILVADAQYTPVHQTAGLTVADMAEVALAYANLALAHPRITTMIGYTWAGGIDGLYERGARDMGDEVTANWRKIGLTLLAN